MVEKPAPVLIFTTIQAFQSFAILIRDVSAQVVSFPDFNLEKSGSEKLDRPLSTLRSGLHRVLSAASNCTGDAFAALLTTRLALRELPDIVITLSKLTDSENAKKKRQRVYSTALKCNNAVDTMVQAFELLQTVCDELSRLLGLALNQKSTELKEMGWNDVAVEEKRKEEKELRKNIEMLRNTLQTLDRDIAKNLPFVPSQRTEKVFERVSAISPYNPRQHIIEQRETTRTRICSTLSSQHELTNKQTEDFAKTQEEIAKVEGQLGKVEAQLADMKDYIAKKEEIDKIRCIKNTLLSGTLKLKETADTWKEVQAMAKEKSEAYFKSLPDYDKFGVVLGLTPDMNHAAYNFIKMAVQLESLSKVYQDYVEKHVQPLLKDATRILGGLTVPENENKRKQEEARLRKTSESAIASATQDQIKIMAKAKKESSERLGISYAPLVTQRSVLQPFSRLPESEREYIDEGEDAVELVNNFQP